MNRHRTSYSDAWNRRQGGNRLTSDPPQRPARFDEDQLAYLERCSPCAT
jgi:hypothetical protein